MLIEDRVLAALKGNMTWLTSYLRQVREQIKVASTNPLFLYAFCISISRVLKLAS